MNRKNNNYYNLQWTKCVYYYSSPFVSLLLFQQNFECGHTRKYIIYSNTSTSFFVHNIDLLSILVVLCIENSIFLFFNFIYITDYFSLNENVINTLQVFCYYILLDSSLCYSFTLIEMEHEKCWDNFANANAADWLFHRKISRDYYLKF